jgi:adenosylcobyric acid synthase
VKHKARALMVWGASSHAGKSLVATACFENTQGPWAALQGIAVEGYEIRVGNTETTDIGSVIARADDGVAVGWQRGCVLGTALHGLFESADVLHALWSCRAPSLDEGLDALADVIAPVCERGPVRHALFG